MKVRSEVIKKINKPQLRTRIAGQLAIGEATVYVHLKNNKDNGRLTKMDALKAISEVIGISTNEILELEQIRAKV